MKKYFLLHFTRTTRRITDTGIPALPGYLIIVSFFAGLSLLLFHRINSAEHVYILIGGWLIVPLSEKARADFLKNCFGNRFYIIRLIENWLAISPFLIFLLFRGKIVASVVLIFLAASLSMLRLNKPSGFVIRTPFSKSLFEFTIGFRSTAYLIMAVYALSGVAVAVGNFNLGIFSMLVMFITIFSYYSKPEQEYFVWIFNQNPRVFLRTKIRTGLLCSLVLIGPIGLLLTVFFPGELLSVLLLILTACGLLVFFILSKYSVYPDSMQLVDGLLLSVCIWMPPLLLILIPYLYKKAASRLNHLLP